MLRLTKRLSVAAIALIATSGGVATAAYAQGTPAHHSPTVLARGEGAAFAMTNSTRDNRIVSYKRTVEGSLIRQGSVSTRGLGIGVDLDTQGPLQLSADHRYLYAVNAGSDNVSVFSVHGTRLKFEQKIYAGDEPTSLTVHGNLVYVLDGSVASNSIRGFTAGPRGALKPIANSIQPLSSPIAVPGDIEFSPDGTRILVTEKTTALTLNPSVALDEFAINRNGVAGPAKRDASNAIRPFAVAFRNNNQVVVGNSYDAAVGKAAVSAYGLDSTGALSPKGSPVPNGQTDTCWIIVTHDGRFAYTANFGANTISQYRFASDGTVSLVRGSAAFLGDGSEPVDLAQTADSHYVYQLLRGTGAVASFRVGADGALTPLAVTKGGLPADYGVSGLAVY